jgi:hypothetical protein
MMRSIYFSIALLLMTSCGKLGTFNIDQTVDVVIPSQFGVNLPFNVNSPEIETNAEATFESAGTSTKRISTIQLYELKLSIVNPTNADFDFLNEIEIFIKAPGLDEKRVAYKQDIPETGLKSFFCDIDDLNLKDYISKEHFSLRVRTITDQVIFQDIQVRIDQKYKVRAKIRK